MKKSIILLLMLIVITMANAQTKKVIGNWLMIKAEVKGKIMEPYFIINFKEDGTMESQGIPLGTWLYNEKDNNITMNSKFDNKFSGKNKVLKITSKRLELEKDGNKFFYTKINPNKVLKDNKASKFHGLWEIKSEEGRTRILQISLPDTFMLVTVDEGSTDRAKGTWLFNKNNNYIVFMGFSKFLKGKYSIKKSSEKGFILENNDKKIVATKKEQPQIERLTFKYDDFDENNDINDKLPWVNFNDMVNYLKDVTTVRYRRGSIIPEFNVLTYTRLKSNIVTKPDKPSVEFTNFLISQTDTMQYSQKYKDNLSESYNFFFPQDELFPLRLVGTKTVTVPAGTFECTVIEGFNGDDKVKYWMINNKPGIYAKIIVERISVFNDLEYLVTELEEIK